MEIKMEDPVESIVEAALLKAEIVFEVGRKTKALDFYLPAMDTYIEVKQFHSERIADQMSRHPNVIAIQGKDAARAFALMIAGDCDLGRS